MNAQVLTTSPSVLPSHVKKINNQNHFLDKYFKNINNC